MRWKIDKDIHLYGFYLDMSVKAAVFLMAVTGAIASYVLSQQDQGVIRLALAFPAIVNGGFAVLFCYSVLEAKRIAKIHIESSRELGVPEFNMNPLWSVCAIFALMCTLATIGLLLLIAFEWRAG